VSETRVDPAPPADADLVRSLRAGDEAAFGALVDAWSPGMLRAARAYVGDAHAAEDVVQDTWLAVLRGIDRFEARSSLRTWTYRILINIAKTRGRIDARVVPHADLTRWSPDPDHGPTVDPSRFREPDDPYPGHWRTAPEAWPSPESAALGAETRRVLAEAVVGLPERQRIVIVLRDVEGYDADDVCQMLDISAANQRVLLHRARAAIRATLANYLTPQATR
jgi:RNA polymerase sigma-70 factor, ECF subfamily